MNGVIYSQRVPRPLKKCSDMSSRGYATHPVGYNPPQSTHRAATATFWRGHDGKISPAW